MVYVTCEDCAVEARLANESGGSILREKMPIGEFDFIAFVNDTEGNMILESSVNRFEQDTGYWFTDENVPLSVSFTG